MPEKIEIFGVELDNENYSIYCEFEYFDQLQDYLFNKNINWGNNQDEKLSWGKEVSGLYYQLLCK